MHSRFSPVYLLTVRKTNVHECIALLPMYAILDITVYLESSIWAGMARSTFALLVGS